jgi:2-methylcitrate dehydratase PrpD
MMLGQIRAGDVTNWKSGATGYALQRALWCYGLGAIFQAPPSTLQGTRGWDALVTPLRVEALQRPGPEVEAVYEQVAVKVYPCFQVAQTPVGCALRLRQELDGRIDRIRAVSVLLSEHGAGIANRAGRPRYPTTHGAADHHVPYCVAVALRYGTLTPAHFDHHFLEQPELRRLVELTEVRSMPPEVVAGEADACTLELTLDDGTRARQSLPRGEGAFSGLSAERRVAQLRSVVEAKRDLLEQASGWDLRPVVELLERLEERDGAALIQQVHACVERDGRAAG